MEGGREREGERGEEKLCSREQNETECKQVGRYTAPNVQLHTQ